MTVSVCLTALTSGDSYPSLWIACDSFPRRIDCYQYKDYVLSMLFEKYPSDIYGESC